MLLWVEDWLPILSGCMRLVGVEPLVYIKTSAANARCIRFLPSLFLAMYPQGDSLK